ncbi:peroxisomal OPC-8:0-CoA ligase 1-like [Silene latifolia]|uniref:peroxisomal OPC-8:0-CoA ligase 1-like n=1 Tax=Silene latifolia TaxID=37657 RepID=UPI003D7806EC
MSSGYTATTSTFHSKRQPIPLPPNPTLDITTFISSRPHRTTTAFIDAITGRHLSYVDLWTAVDSLSHSLSSIYGIRKGHVVLILSPNSIYFPIVCLSVMSLGALITTANPLNTNSEIAKQLADSGPKLVFVTRELVGKLTGCGVPVVLLEEGEGKGAGVVSSLGELLMKGGGGGSEVRREKVRQNDAAALLYSSGTTGVSKGVVSSHRNMIAMVQTIIQRFTRTAEGSGSLGTFICTVRKLYRDTWQHLEYL